MTAGALLAGAFLSAFLQVVFDRLAFCDVVDYLKGRQCIEGLLQKLKMELMSADEVLIDAEEKQITNPAVKEWLDELEDAVYVADDLLEEIATEALRCKSETTHESVGSEVRALIPTSDDSFDKNIQSKLEKILARLEIITKKKDVLYLKKVVVGEPSQPLATSFHEDNAVYGRDIDRETILKNLQSNDASGDEVCVISIVGVGGVGKTTLARLVYNDEKVNDHFDLKAWICVSEKFDSFTIAKTIFKEVISSDRDAQNLNMLQTKIATLVRKKILIVLDDVRNENNIAWDELVAIFGHRKHEIKIIITTCSEAIASIVHPISTHHLSQLSNEDCWLLFARHAFKNRESSEYVDLEVIGREIVHKCKGLPLAVKTIGGLLGFKQDPREWGQILESNIWNLSEGERNIIPALKLSYNYLPPHLKRCFAYCSIFPRDYIFLKEELVLFWMAEDLLLKPKGNERMEEIGEQYFDDLESRSFFQRSNSDKSCFIMHDLVYDLAKFISREFVFKLEIKNLCEITRKTLHLSYYKSDFDVSKIVEVSHKAKGLRSLLELEWPSECSWACNDMTKTIDDWPSQCSCSCNDMTKRIDDLLHKFRCLRVLSLSNIKVLPDSIGNLKHLCYLNLSTTEIQRLPDSICTVYNLQTLLLFACLYLVELPTNMGRLVNLRYLDIRLTPIKEMPLHIGKLRNLQHLSDFRVGKDGGCSIRELGELGHLSGTLCISNLQNVHCSSDANAMEVNLKDKKYLSQLELIWGLDHNTNHSENDIHVLEQLLPHTNLKSLIIFNFRGKKFPNWLGDGSFSNMVSLKLRHCKYCTLLPPLGQLPALKELEISAFQGLSQVDCDFYGNGSFATSPFKSLEKLTFEDMRDWKEWFTFKGEHGGKIFHTLQELRIIKCPKLTGNLPSYLPSLTILTIEKCEQLVASLPRPPTLKELHLTDCDQVAITRNRGDITIAKGSLLSIT